MQGDLFSALASPRPSPVAAPVPGVEDERRRRIRVALAAYAYEVEDAPIMSDAEYDALARSIDLAVSTGHAALDAFFREHFAAHTGAWVRQHPSIERLAQIYRLMWG